MADELIYLDVDDEITSAAARIRAATGTTRRARPAVRARGWRPRGSTSVCSPARRLNAEARLSIVAADAAARALAASAGLPVFASVAEYEAAIGPPRTPGPRPAPGAGEAALPATDDLPRRPDRASAPRAPRRAVVVVGRPAAGLQRRPERPPGPRRSSRRARPAPRGRRSEAAPTARPEQLLGGPPRADHRPARDRGRVAASQPSLAAPELPPGPPEAGPARAPRRSPWSRAVRRRGVPSGLALALGGVLVAVLIVAAAYLLLPQATVVLTPVACRSGRSTSSSGRPRRHHGRCGRRGRPGDPAEPGLHSLGQYPATGPAGRPDEGQGQRDVENCNPAPAITIPAGTVVSTDGGIDFRNTSEGRPAGGSNPAAERSRAQTRDVAVSSGPPARAERGRGNIVNRSSRRDSRFDRPQSPTRSRRPAGTRQVLPGSSRPTSTPRWPT